MEYLEPEEIIEMNRTAIKNTGGQIGVMQRANLDYICYRAKSMKGDATKKAAYYLNGLAFWAHAFVDGNKRTALASTVKFLEDIATRVNKTTN